MQGRDWSKYTLVTKLADAKHLCLHLNSDSKHDSYTIHTIQSVPLDLIGFETLMAGIEAKLLRSDSAMPG